jgi:acyl-CoA thioester hydrolase
MTLHVDMSAKKVTSFPDSILRILERMKTAHAGLPRPEGAGRSIKMPDKG